MKINKYYILSGILIISLILLGFSIAYSYFAATVINNSEDYLTVQAGDLKISYLNGTLIDEDNIIPGWSQNKYFTIKNESTVREDISYNIYLNVTENNFFTKYSEINNVNELSGNSYLTYSLFKCSNSKTDCNSINIDNKIINIQDSIQEGNILVATRSIAKDATDHYALRIEFPNLTNINQSQKGTDGNPLKFAAYVIINN